MSKSVISAPIFSILGEDSLAQNICKFRQEQAPNLRDVVKGRTNILRQHLSQVNVPAGAHVHINNDHHKLPASTSRKMKRRLHALQDKEFPYDSDELNCEHFATFVRYGAAVCNQVT